MEVNEMLVRAEFYTLNCIRISPIITDGYIKTSTEVCTVRSPLFLALGGLHYTFNLPPAGKQFTFTFIYNDNLYRSIYKQCFIAFTVECSHCNISPSFINHRLLIHWKSIKDE